MNAYDDVSKPKKGLEHITTIFVFKHGVVLLCQEKLKGKPGKNKVSIVARAVYYVEYKFIIVIIVTITYSCILILLLLMF